MSLSSQHTTLTPGFNSFNLLVSGELNDGHFGVSSFRQMREKATSLLREGFIDSSLVFFRELILSKDATNEDYEQLAKAYFLNGEYRRSLITLEQQDFLSLNEIQKVIEWMNSNSNSNYKDNDNNNNNNRNSNTRDDEQELNIPSDIKTQSNKMNQSKQIIEKLNIFLLAAQCLFKLEKYDDCIGLLEQFLSLDEILTNHPFHFVFSLRDKRTNTNPLSSIFYLVGKCFDILENRVDSVRILCLAVRLDPSCVQAVDYLIEKRLISSKEKQGLYQQLPVLNGSLQYLDSFYRSRLMDHEKLVTSTFNIKSSHAIICQAEKCYESHMSEEAYKLARKAYYLDPSDQHGLVIYIAAAMDLQLVSEIYYIGHELTSISPKQAVSWYAVGCYYYCCKKYELSQKYLTKATKIDKRFIYAWIALGHCLSSMQESEHAVSSYRTAVRLAPGDYFPLLCISRELIRMNNFSMALHFLMTASQKDSNDPQTLNEIGVVLLKLGRYKMSITIQESLQYFEEAVNKIGIKSEVEMGSTWQSLERGCAIETLSNYGLALRKNGNFEKSIQCYEAAESLNPQDPDIHSNLGFLHHILRRFDQAISFYHFALALRPTMPMIQDLLQKALIDKETFGQVN